MSVSELELQRARRILEDFCVGRNRVENRQLACLMQGNDIVIMETSQQEARGLARSSTRPLVRLHYADRGWRVFWSRDDGLWEPYIPLPLTRSIHDVVDELERAPLHVHWA
ncbi:MAG: DUF3024 domain-containing protein [Gammaproteobacteria bacterium]